MNFASDDRRLHSVLIFAEQEMKNNETEEGSNENEPNPEDESHRTVQQLVDNQFGRNLRRQLE
jgi:hypothetical protein